MNIEDIKFCLRCIERTLEREHENAIMKKKVARETDSDEDVYYFMGREIACSDHLDMISDLICRIDKPIEQ